MKTKHYLLYALAAMMGCGTGFAQDDVYFVPSKKKQQPAAPLTTSMSSSSYENLETSNAATDYDNWYEGLQSPYSTRQQLFQQR